MDLRATYEVDAFDVRSASRQRHIPERLKHSYVTTTDGHQHSSN